MIQKIFALIEQGENLAENQKFKEASDCVNQALILLGNLNMNFSQRTEIMQLMENQKQHYEEQYNRLLQIPTPDSKPIFENSIEILIESGLNAMREGEEYLLHKDYIRALDVFTQAKDNLTQAGWSHEKLNYIYKIIHKLTKLIDQPPEMPAINSPTLNMSVPEPVEEEYIPTFMKTGQSDVIPVKKSLTQAVQPEISYEQNGSKPTVVPEPRLDFLSEMKMLIHQVSGEQDPSKPEEPIQTQKNTHAMASNGNNVHNRKNTTPLQRTNSQGYPVVSRTPKPTHVPSFKALEPEKEEPFDLSSLQEMIREAGEKTTSSKSKSKET